MNQVVARPSRKRAALFLDRPERGEIELPVLRVAGQVRTQKAQRAMGIATHDLVHSLPGASVVLFDSPQAVLGRPVADVLTPRRRRLLPREQKASVLVAELKRGLGKKENIPRLQARVLILGRNRGLERFLRTEP